MRPEQLDTIDGLELEQVVTALEEGRLADLAAARAGPKQLDAEDVRRLSPEEVVAALEEGLLADYLPTRRGGNR